MKAHDFELVYRCSACGLFVPQYNRDLVEKIAELHPCEERCDLAEHSTVMLGALHKIARGAQETIDLVNGCK
jgi:hypothetical protein